MTLETARIKFCEVSGRADLINTDDSDNGADWYIQQGQKFLDHHPLSPRIVARSFQDVAADAFYLALSRYRTIEEVWVNNDEGRSKLEKRDLDWLRAEYSATTAETTSGTPLYYAPAKLRGTDITDVNSIGTFMNYVLSENSADGVQGIIFFPPTDEALTVEVIGQALADEMTADDHTNFWTENFEHILVMAGLRVLEVFYRNTAGVKDWESAINTELRNISLSDIEQEITDITEMTG